MNSLIQSEFSKLLAEGVIEATIMGSAGGAFGTYWHEFYVFIPGLQKKLAGVDNLDDFEGVHQLDFPQFCGQGFTLEEAFANFCVLNIELPTYYDHATNEEDLQGAINRYIDFATGEKKQ